MRVAIFTETFLPKMDGIVRVVCLLLDHLHSKGIETIIFAPKLGEEVRFDYNGSRVITIDGMPIPWYPELRMTPPSPTVFREMQAFQPDIAHFFQPITVGIPGLLIAKQMNVPTLTSFHLDMAQMAMHHSFGPIKLSFLRPITNYLTKMVFNWADYSLAPSRAIQREMLELGIRDVGLWKRGVDAQRFNPTYRSDAMRQRLSDGHPDETILLYVGRLSHEKHVHKLRPLLDAVPGVRLALVGDGPYRPELEKLFAGTPTKFMGYLHGEDLSQAYASADVFTFPSALETFGLVVVEAMAAGLPVVASQVGGIPDVVQEGHTGYTFPIGDVDGLIAGVQEIVRDPAKLTQMGRAARAYAETQTWDHMMDEVIEIYERLIFEKNQIRATA
jgi:glycosyltransferase involved in cell wall biosynthesis